MGVSCVSCLSERTDESNTGTKYVDLAYTTQHGFASVGSNNGHNGTTAITMYHNPDVVTDFAWRSCVVLISCSPAPLSPSGRVANLLPS